MMLRTMTAILELFLQIHLTCKEKFRLDAVANMSEMVVLKAYE